MNHWFGLSRIWPGFARRGLVTFRRRGRSCAARRMLRALETLEDRLAPAAYAIEQLTFTAAGLYQEHASISDDGARIAFVSSADLEGSGRNAEGRPELFLYDARTERFRQITDGSGISPNTEIDLSGDGNRIVFTSTHDLTGENSEGNQEVFLYDIAAARFTQVTESVLRIKQRPSISFDGSRIAYQATNPTSEFASTYLADLSGPAPTHRLVLERGENPSISGNGARIAVESTRDLGANPDLNREIFLYDVAAQAIRQITHTQDATNASPSLSGDGARLAFSSNADLTGAGQDELPSPYLYADETGGFTKVSSNPLVANVQISTDGSRVGYFIARGSGILVVNDVETRSEVTLASDPNLPLPGAPRPAFSLSGDGSRIAFVYDSAAIGADPDGNFELFVAVEVEAPIAHDDFITTPEDVDFAINVLENDVDPQQSPLQVLTLAGLPEHGRATFNNNGRVVYRPDENFFGADSFAYVVENIYGVKATGTVFVTVLPVNDPTLIEAPAFASVNEDEALVFSAADGNAITIGDVDIGNGPLEVQITVSGGTIALGDLTGITGDQKDNVTTFMGRLGPINGALEGMKFTPNANYNGPAAIDIQVKDLLAAANDPAATDTHLVKIAVQAINDAPVNTVPGLQSGFEGFPLPIAGISVFDFDAAEGDGLLRVTLSVDHGTLQVNPAVPGGVQETQIIGNGTIALNLTATQDAINATLASADGLVYRPDLNFSGEDQLIVTTNDLGNTGIPEPRTDLDSVAIAILSVEQQIGDLVQFIDTQVTIGLLRVGNAKSLLVKLDFAQTNLANEKWIPAIQVVISFRNEVESLVEEGVLSEEDGKSLLEASDWILAGISSRLEA